MPFTRRDRPVILRIVSRMAVGGVQNGILETLRRRDAEKFDYRLLCTKKLGVWAPQAEALGVPVALQKALPPWNPFQILRLSRVIARIAPDLVHVHLAPLVIPAVTAARLAGARRVIVHHHSDYTDRHWAKQNALLRAWEFRLTRGADVILAVSGGVARATCAALGLPPTRVEVIPNGIDLARFQAAPDPAALARIRTEWNVQDGAPLVVQVSRFLESKRVEDFLDAAAIVSARWPAGRPRPVFAVVGDGPAPLRKIYEAKLSSLPSGVSAVLAGSRQDLPEILQAADAGALATEIEGCPNTILEYMAAGLPFAATDIVAITEIASHDRHALLSKPRDAAALAANIERLLLDAPLAARLAAAARQAVQGRDWSAAARAAEALYTRLLDANSAPPPNN